MCISKEELVLGITEYIRNEVIKDITDEHFKFILTASIYAIEINPSIINSILQSEIIKAAFNECDGQYDLDNVEKVLTKTLTELGYYTITVPATKFILPEEQILKFTASDVGNLFKCLRSVSHG